jgi:RNA polymerase sigma-70 factor (ECF subfamily)
MTEPAGPSTIEIQSCLERLQAGDESARQQLLQAAYDRLERLARKMLQSYPRLKRWEDTGDVLQNAALRLHRALGEVKPASVVDFLRLAAVNIRRELLDMTKHYFGPEGEGAHHATPKPDPETRSDGNAPPAQKSLDPAQLAMWTEFHRQVSELPDEEREVFDLLWYQGLSQAEAAGLLHVSERTIKRRWQSARLLLHDRMHGQMPDA